jgi:HAD superfamily hydrolase (TIGR01490 family)
VTLAIFDLDNTLIGGDSDHLWGQFVHEQGLVDGDNFAAQADAFYSDYEAGQLDIDAYLRFALSPLKDRSVEEAAKWHRQFMQEKIDSIMLPRAEKLVQEHRARGDQLLIITATNAFITRPIAQRMGIEELIACEAEVVDGVYTGEPIGIPSFQQGKVTRLNTWMDEHNAVLDGAWFYSDSHNDLPLLEIVDNPVAVDPDAKLDARARELGWQVMSLRD